MEECASVKEEFIQILKALLPSLVLDADSEEAIINIYNEMFRKLCNTKVQEFISVTKQELELSTIRKTMKILIKSI